MHTWGKSRRLAATGLAAGAVLFSSVGCTNWVAKGLNPNQWSAGQTRNSVVALGDQFDIRPFTYVGHDPCSYKAADFMLPGGGHNAYWVQRGWQLAHYAWANRTKLGVHYIVYRQSIINVDRAAEGWRLMANRGSWTANHMDHVHVSFR